MMGLFRNGAIAATAISLASLSVAASALAAPRDEVATISVSATGATTASPDMAIINLGVQTNADTASLALGKNTESMNKVLAAMKAAGIEARDVQTAGFSVQPLYDKGYSSKASSADAKGYSASNTVSVRVRDLAKLGGILDQTVGLGVNMSNSLIFTNADTAPFNTKARQDAVKEARQRAETLAEAAGVKLGRIVEINEGVARPSPLRGGMATMDAIAMNAPVAVAAGELSYQVNVTVTFEIEE